MTTPTQGEHAQPATSYEQQRAIMEGERNASLALFDHDGGLTLAEERLYESAFTNGWDRHAAVVAPTPAPMSPANRLVAYSAATRLRELGFEWDATAEAWLQPAQPAAPQGGAYAELPTPDLPRGGFPDLFTASKMRDFADRTHALRASHGQAPAATPKADSQPAPNDEAILSAARNWGDVQQYKRTDGKGTEHRIVFSMPRRAAHFARELLAARTPADSVTAPAVASEPIAYLYDDGSWTPAKTEEGRKLNDWMISAGSPKIGVHLASTAQPTPLTTLAQATQAGNQQEARPCHVFTVRKAGGLTEWEPTTMALALPDGAHALYTLPQPSPHAHAADSVPVAPFDDPKVQTVYAILCEDAEPPKGEHWEGFAARRIVDALSSDSVLEDAARLNWLEGQSQVNIERVRYLGADASIYEVTPFNSTDYNGETLREAIDAARKQGANHD